MVDLLATKFVLPLRPPRRAAQHSLQLSPQTAHSQLNKLQCRDDQLDLTVSSIKLHLWADRLEGLILKSRRSASSTRCLTR